MRRRDLRPGSTSDLIAFLCVIVVTFALAGALILIAGTGPTRTLTTAGVFSVAVFGAWAKFRRPPPTSARRSRLGAHLSYDKDAGVGFGISWGDSGPSNITHREQDP
ncbi:hypothetical protein ACWDBF_31315 [Streptomyces angustmyceticus]